VTDLNLAILGLTRLEISIGMAIARNSAGIRCIGFDRDKKVASQVARQNIFAQTTHSLKTAVSSADVVLLAPQLDEVQSLLKDMAPFLIEEAMIVYCGTLPGQVAKWVREILPANVFFTALTPTFNPRYLGHVILEEPCADLFDNSLMFISHSPEVPPQVVDVAIALTRRLGALPHFSDLQEVDGLQTLTEILPILSAAALMLELKKEPGWEDARNLAGERYASATLPLDRLMEYYNLGSSMLLHKDRCLRLIANLQDSLVQLGGLISEEKTEELRTTLDALRASRQKWVTGRQALAASSQPAKKK